LHGRRRPPPVWTDRPFGAPQQVRDVTKDADWRVRPDHSVEFSHGHPFLEGHASAGLRQYGCVEARHGHAALRPESGHGARKGRRAAWSRESGFWYRFGSWVAAFTA